MVKVVILGYEKRMNKKMMARITKDFDSKVNQH